MELILLEIEVRFMLSNLRAQDLVQYRVNSGQARFNEGNCVSRVASCIFATVPFMRGTWGGGLSA